MQEHCSAFEILKDAHFGEQLGFYKITWSSCWRWLAKILPNANQETATVTHQLKLDVDGYLTLLNAKCNLHKICVHKEFALVREDPKDRLDIQNCFLKEDRSTHHNLQTEAFQETLPGGSFLPKRLTGFVLVSARHEQLSSIPNERFIVNEHLL